MIARFLSLAVVCVLFSVYANAQTNKNNTVSKGYYSIGNNAEKLHKQQPEKWQEFFSLSVAK